MTFDEAFELLIGHEGGYVNNPNDPGGETKYGISRRQYPGEDIANMTLERAKTIAKRDFWGPAGCDVVPDAVKFDLFDTASIAA
jgi:lysozyme family protein